MNIADRIDAGALPRLDATVQLVVSSRADAPGVAKAKARGFDVRIASRSAFNNDERAMHDAIARWLDERSIDLVCLCGYLRLLRVDESWRGRIMNIHPALLPDFGGPGMHGEHVHRAVLESRRAVSGCTVHFVDEHYDRGPIILQRTCPVLPGDTPETLAARVFEQECIAYPEAIQLFAEGRLRLEGDRVVVLPGATH